MDWPEYVRTGAAVVASGSVVIAVQAFWEGRKQAQTAFEDALAREYRGITGALPAGAFFNDAAVDLSDEERKAMFRYFDLSNEQLRLAEEGRIRAETVVVWRAGIRDLMGETTFRAAWLSLHPHLPQDFFSSLNRLMAEQERDASETA